MGLLKKFQFLMENPNVLYLLPSIKAKLNINRINKVSTWCFQCDFKGHFSYLKPYWNLLKNDSQAEIYFSILPRKNEVSPKAYLIEQGINPQNIIEPAEMVQYCNFDVYMSPTEWGNIFPKNRDCLRTQIFHTLGDKGLEYSKALLNFNTIFVNGPLHHHFLKKYVFDLYPDQIDHIHTHNIGFAKLDELFDGSFKKSSIKEDLGIATSDNRKIVLYAPNWEKSSALYEYGEKVFEALADTDYIVLIKLHYMSLLTSKNLYATNGYDWNKILAKYQDIENFIIIKDQSINPYLVVADMMVTDYGGASFEFMLLNKPIVYLDCPGFFEERGHHVFEKNSRESGIIINNTAKLNEAILLALNDDNVLKEKRREMIEKLIYNKGCAALHGVQTLKSLLRQQATS